MRSSTWGLCSGGRDDASRRVPTSSASSPSHRRLATRRISRAFVPSWASGRAGSAMPPFLQCVLFVLLSGAPAAPPETPRFTPLEDARPILSAMREALPEGLAGLADERLASAWPAWVRERDRAVRVRLVRG